jgi:sec-independent protein translocase protein TatA
MVGDILQPTHLIFVLVVALLVLGPKKLPEVGRQLGNGLRDFRAAINGERPEPEEVRAPYEEPASVTAPEHAFAHDPGETTAESHEFAHAGSDPTAEGHESSEATADGHEFAHEPETSSADQAQDGEKPAGGHEFAYETSEASDKRTDPLT